MGIIAKGAKCSVSGCDNDGIRSINTAKVEMPDYVFQLVAKNQFFVRSIIKNGKKKLRMTDH